MARSVAEIEKLRKDTEGGKVYRAEVNTSASAEAVYDVLTDLQTHLPWTGLKGREGLITMEGPPATARSRYGVPQHLRRQLRDLVRSFDHHRDFETLSLRVHYRR